MIESPSKMTSRSKFIFSSGMESPARKMVSTMTHNSIILVSCLILAPSLVSGYVPIDVIQDEKTKKLHRIDSLNLLAYTGLLIVMVCTIWLFKVRRLRYLHETGLAIFYGLIVGAIIRYSGHKTTYTKMIVSSNESHTSVGSPPDSLWIDLPIKTGENSTDHRDYIYTFRGQLSKSTQQINAQKATFDPELFFNLILPPIIFNAGYSMKRRFFFRNIGAIMTYAFLGTTISCISIGFIIYAFIWWSPSLYSIFNLSDCFYFGAVISATDPVTVLAIFNDLHVDVTLYALVFGESILNDAVAITLCSAIDSFSNYYRMASDHPALEAALHALYTFLYTFLASFLLGSGTGCLTALITKFTRLSEQPLLETALFVLMSYTAFLCSEAMELSGIVAVLFCGICQAHYTFNNLSDESRARTKQVFELLNFIAENFIFTYIGVSMFTFPKNEWSFGFIIVAVLAVYCGRALSVYPLSLLLNLGRRNKIPINFQHMLMFSGLRGGMAFALALRNTLSEARQIMLTTTSLIVIFSVIGCGGLTSNILNYLGIPTGVDENEHELLAFSSVRRSGSASTPSDLQSPAIEGGQATGVKSPYEKAWLVRKWYNFDVKIMKPLLTHARPTLMDTLPDCCLPIARCLTTTEQLSQEMFEPDIENW